MTGGTAASRGLRGLTVAADQLERAATSVGAWWATPDARRDRIVTVASAVGYGIALAALVTVFVLPDSDGGIGFDAHSYFVAGQNVLKGQPLYWQTAIDAYGPYRYPPLFAQLWAPFTLLPELAFHWLWRAACFACLFYLAGSWRALGLWFLVPFTLTELSAANVTFPVAAATLAAFRGDVRWLPVAALLKVGSLVAVPFVWFRRPQRLRTLLISAAALAGVVLASVVVDPASWRLYVESLGWQSSSSQTGAGLFTILPTTGADFVLRGAIALTVLAVAIWRDWPPLAYVATILAVPTLWIQRLCTLLATPRATDRPTDRPSPGG